MRSARSGATRMCRFDSLFAHPTWPGMLSLFLLYLSNQNAPPSEAKASPITALLKTRQSPGIKSSSHSPSTYSFPQWVPTALTPLLFFRYSREPPVSLSQKHFPPSEVPSCPKYPPAQIPYLLPVPLAPSPGTLPCSPYVNKPTLIL